MKKLILWLKTHLFRGRVYYIGQSRSLPAPLNPEEELAAMERLGRGDEGVKSLLIERNLRLVVFLARKFDNTGVPLEDLVSIGTIGLIKAVNTYDPFKKIKLATYASRCIENEILMHLRHTSRLKGEVSIDEPLTKDPDGNELLLSDILGTEGDVIFGDLEKEIDRDLLHEALTKLSPREQYIMEMRFGLNGRREQTQKEVAETMGISQSYISRLEKKIIRRLRKELDRVMLG